MTTLSFCSELTQRVWFLQTQFVLFLHIFWRVAQQYRLNNTFVLVNMRFSAAFCFVLNFERCNADV